jgi:hypothetical protein
MPPPASNTVEQEKVVPIRQPSDQRHQPASLLGLPRKLRDIIYEHCLPATTIKYSLRTPCLPLFGADLRRTCRQLYHETRDLAWTRGALLLHDYRDRRYTSIRSKPTFLVSRAVLQAKLPGGTIADAEIIARVESDDRSESALHLTPGDLIIRICTCGSRSEALATYQMGMILLRSGVMPLVGAWPSVEGVTFFYCHDVGPRNERQFPSSWRSAFSQDARYFGPWNPEKKSEGLDGEEGVWCLKYYDGRGQITRTVGLDFFDVADVYGAKCALNVGPNMQ